MELIINGVLFSTQKEKLNKHGIHNFLCNQSYWSKNISMEVVEKAIEHSLCFGAYKNEKLVGFARLVTDYATFGYLADVFIIENERGKGISKDLMKFIMEVVTPMKLRRLMLATLDAHSLYELTGFRSLKEPERFMEISNPGVYGDNHNICQ